MDAKTYAEEMYTYWTVTKEGPEHAVKIAKRNMDASAPENWKDLPVGPVFGTKGYGSDHWDMKTNEFRKTYNFWVLVYNILRKKVK